MAKALTVRSVEAEKPGPSRREIPDGHMPGLFLIIQPTGGKSWAVRYRHGARTRKLTIGAFPAFGLADARKAAGDALRAVAEGRDPALEKSLQKAEQADESNLVKNVLGRYDREYLQKRQSPKHHSRRPFGVQKQAQARLGKPPDQLHHAGRCEGHSLTDQRRGGCQRLRYGRLL